MGVGVSQHGPATQGKTVPRILVADDNTNIQKMVVLAFQERGIEVIAVGNGEAAVRRIPDANPDLVLADVFMPVRNGYEVCEFVKKDPRFAQTPVILLVGAFDPLDEKEARRVGADGVLKKPFVPPDPLIAMVMSALEKNPKVIAELAKAKEAKEAAAALASLPTAAMESPMKAEVKPLPEFPEPSAEEAAMIYGFGKGVRAIDSEEPEEDEAEAKSKLAAQGLKDPQAGKKSKTPAAAAPKTPVVQMEEEDEKEDTFDASVTASDWRRNAAELEVPDNVEANPIYSYGKNFEPITFPSEKDVPPKHVRAEAAADADEVVAKSEDVAASVATPEVKASSDASANWELTTEAESTVELVAPPAVEAASTEVFAAEEAPAHGASAVESLVSANAAEQTAISDAVVPATEAPSVTSSISIETTTEITKETSKEAQRPSFVARVRGWMDMMSSSSDEPAEPQAESSEQHWMTSLSSADQSSKVAEQEAVAAPLSVSAVENPVKMAEVEELAETAALPAVVEAPAVSESEPFAQEVSAEPAAEQHFEPAPVDNFESFTGDANQSDLGASSYGSDQVAVSETLSDPEPVAQEEVAPQEPVHEEIHAEADEASLPQLSTSEPSHGASHEHWSSLMQASSEVATNGDGNSSHQPLEPIINDLHQQPVSATNEIEEEPAHVAAWLRTRAAAEESRTEDVPPPAEAFQAEPALNAWNQQTIESTLDETPFADQVEPVMFENQPAQPFADRIPTLPPPNREALAGIPFLMPRPEAEPVASNGSDAANSAAVDEVVRRVLEKLQPQLHELLSQGVKPLVENMLQHELKNELQRNEKV
jgi:CheY-like chemotaxis protein